MNPFLFSYSISIKITIFTRSLNNILN